MVVVPERRISYLPRDTEKFLFHIHSQGNLYLIYRKKRLHTHAGAVLRLISQFFFIVKTNSPSPSSDESSSVPV